MNEPEINDITFLYDCSDIAGILDKYYDSKQKYLKYKHYLNYKRIILN